MNDIDVRLAEKGLKLPESPPPLFNYVPYVVTGNLVFIAGQVPIAGDTKLTGRLGDDYTLEQGQKAAQLCGLNILAQLKSAVKGDWSRVVRCVKLGGFVQCTPDFTDMSVVINGCSDLMVEAMGDAGRHARFAVGAPALPAGFAVEVDAVFEIKP